jgi:hypothetical protein
MWKSRELTLGQNSARSEASNLATGSLSGFKDVRIMEDKPVEQICFLVRALATKRKQGVVEI